ncbi:MAG: SRPBCC family protein [Ekhidna sp.]
MNKNGKLIAPTTLQFERMLPGPIDRVWEYLTDAEKRGKWFASGSVSLNEGSQIKFVFNNNQLSSPIESPPTKYQDFGDGFVSYAKVIKSEAPHLFVIEWEGLVTFKLESQDEGVKLTLTHEKLEDTHETRVGTMSGWHTHLNILEVQLAGKSHEGGFWTTHMSLEEVYEKIV